MWFPWCKSALKYVYSWGLALDHVGEFESVPPQKKLPLIQFLFIEVADEKLSLWLLKNRKTWGIFFSPKGQWGNCQGTQGTIIFVRAKCRPYSVILCIKKTHTPCSGGQGEAP